MNSIETSVGQLQGLFTIVMALAIGEGLKQFAREVNDLDQDAPQHLRWRCFYGLVAVLITAMPFTYGMVRYFFEAYKSAPLDKGYGLHLLFDSVAFTIEAIMFFVMSRSLSPGRSRVFALAAFLIFVVDIVWVLKCKFCGLPSGRSLDTWWIVQDPIIAFLLLVIVGAHWRWPSHHRRLYVAACTLLIVEAGVDVPLNWTFYFPSASRPSEVVTSMRNTKVYFAGPLFTQAQWRWNARLIQGLRGEGYEVISPQERALPMLEGRTPFDPHALFQANIEGIDRSNVVVAILDGTDVDSGTAWECGYAYRKGRPVIGVRTDLRAGGDDPKASVNLMLSQACKEVVSLPLSKRDDESWLIQKVVEATKRVKR